MPSNPKFNPQSKWERHHNTTFYTPCNVRLAEAHHIKYWLAKAATMTRGNITKAESGAKTEPAFFPVSDAAEPELETVPEPVDAAPVPVDLEEPL